MTPEEILQTNKVFAIVGASNDPLKYGFELVEIFKEYGYTIYPINPKYYEIDGIQCYPSLKELPGRPHVVVSALAPINSINVVSVAKEICAEYIWFPPNCFDDRAIEKAKELQLNIVSDVCPLGLLKKMHAAGGHG